MHLKKIAKNLKIDTFFFFSTLGQLGSKLRKFHAAGEGTRLSPLIALELEFFLQLVFKKHRILALTKRIKKFHDFFLNVYVAISKRI